ncbi:hypothetical protein GPALN_002220 [Globodera pallida]|uniref:ELM2 domain-containing protein n=1 Tax=Globodera pallida TaxID=36090 RepID=A0A183C8E0_GLOPA|nr:hypothetical protein GPALN_002220 [Globodera pallida]
MVEVSSDQRRRSPQLRADKKSGRSRVRKHRKNLDEDGWEARSAPLKAVRLPCAPTTKRTQGRGPIESKPVHSVQPKEDLRAADDIMWSPFN